MKHLTDNDILEMAAGEFSPDTRAVNRDVRAQLRLAQLIPARAEPVPDHATLDLHQRTEQQAWDAIMALARTRDVRSATIITGASGILKIKFQEWVRESLLTPYVTEMRPLNNGSFYVKFHRPRKRPAN